MKRNRKDNYYIIRVRPGGNDTEVVPFKSMFEMESWLNGCSNPERCIPARRLPVRVRKRYEIVEESK